MPKDNEPKKPNYDLLARNYILSIKKGILPEGDDVPDDFGKWDVTVSQIERLYRRYYKECGTEKIADKMSDIIDSMAQADPALAKLIAPKVKKQPEVKPEDEPVCPPLPDGKFGYLIPLARSACKWLDDCVEFLRKWSPRGYEGYYEAVAMSILSTVAARRVVIDFGGPEYTPLFTALVGPTSWFKKSTTGKHFSGLIEAAGLDWLLGADITTPQKLLSNMAGKKLPENWEELTDDEKEREKKRLAFAGQIGWYYDEFGNHLDAMVKENGVMADFCGLLRLLDDGKKRHRYDTHRRGKEVIHNPALSLLAALTDDDIKPHAQKGNKFWGNGLFARFAFVCVPRGTKFKRDRALTEKLVYPQPLTFPLYFWHTWLGEPDVEVQPPDKDGGKYNLAISDLPEKRVSFPKEVQDAYYAFEGALMDMCEPRGDDKPALVHKNLWGNYARLPKIALRIAMLLASFEAAQNRSTVEEPPIEMRHWARAQAFAEERRKDLHELFAQVNTPDDSASAEMEEEVLRHITRLAERGQEWVTANGLRGYMKGKSREEIEDKLKALEKVKTLESQKTTQSIKYRLRPEEESPEDE